MKLNAFEKAAMNNPFRAFVQRNYEAPLLLKLGGRCDAANALEIGCGRGVGVQIILDKFGAAHVDAFDLDPEMITIAQRRLDGYADRVQLTIGDAATLTAPNDSYDAVFDFGIIHHIPDWRRVLAEVRRVLRPGGRFYFEEVTRHALNRWTARTFTRHPRDDRFSGEEFLRQLANDGIDVGDRVRYRIGADFVIGVGIRSQ